MKKLIFMICVLVLSGCGAVTDRGIQHAYRACDNYGGLRYIEPLYIMASDSNKVTCNDGNIYIMHLPKTQDEIRYGNR